MVEWSRGPKLKRGEYEPGKRGGKGYYYSVQYESPEGTLVTVDKWRWVEAPKGTNYVVINGSLVHEAEIIQWA